MTPSSAAPPAKAAAGDGGESTTTVVLALLANLGVAVAKAVAGVLTGSGALLSEAAHSVGDTTTEVLLLTALRRSARPADRRHPFGYGKERYAWSLVAAVSILAIGAAFAAYQGVHTITARAGGPAPDVLVNYVVLAAAAVLEGLSLRQGLAQARGEARASRVTVSGYLRDPDDPTVKSVVYEDAAALIGLVLAAAGVGLHQLTGSGLWDGAASLGIAALLVGVAVALVRTNLGLLTGQQADPRVVWAIAARLEAEPEIVDVVDILTMRTGVDRLLLCARVDLVDALTAAEVEKAMVRISESLSERFDDLDEVFLQPVPREDAGLRRRVLARYGRVLADVPDGGAPERRPAAVEPRAAQ